MSGPLLVGVLAVQGAVEEHVQALHEAAELDPPMDIDVIEVRSAADAKRVAGLILPGGESTTISRLLRSSGIEPVILERAAAGEVALFGTCAGLILLCATAPHDVADKDIHLLGLLDADVDRNAFGRQRDSFESALDVAGIGPVPAVFIRAPSVTRVWGETEVLATSGDEGRIVAIRRGKTLATSFHPELTPDRRIHRAFLESAAGGA